MKIEKETLEKKVQQLVKTVPDHLITRCVDSTSSISLCNFQSELT